MKAVLCLWAREHLKGRPGPGSGLARLLKKKTKKHNTLLCVCACMCVCLAKSGKTGRLCPATLGRDTPRNRQSCRCWGETRDERMVSPALKAADLLIPVVLLQVRLASPYIQRCNTSIEGCRGEMKMQRRRWNILQGSLCWRIMRGRNRISADCFHPLFLCLDVSDWAPDCWRHSVFTCMDLLDYYLSGTWAGCCRDYYRLDHLG